jgi:hypothetical protein
MAPAFCCPATLVAVLRKYNVPKFSVPKLTLPPELLPASQALSKVALTPRVAVLLSACANRLHAHNPQQQSARRTVTR